MLGGSVGSRRPLDPPGVVGRVLPFAAAASVAFLAVALPPSNPNPAPTLAAGALTALIILAALSVPWARLPEWAHAIPPMAYFAVVALLREAEGGATSGYSPLLMLPFFWLSLHGTRSQVVIGAIAVVATLTIPILLIGPPHYPASEWRRALIWATVAPVVGLAIQNLVANIERLARTDALTRLPNRRVWEQDLQQAMARSRRRRDPLSIAIVDLDHFKRFNDTHGHPAGDRLLAEAGAAWSKLLRGGDIVARLGGEEFGVLMHSTTIQEAKIVVERIRRATPGGETASAGIAEWDQDEPFADLVRRADRALYEAKEAGRDRTVASRSAPGRGGGRDPAPNGRPRDRQAGRRA